MTLHPSTLFHFPFYSKVYRSCRVIEEGIIVLQLYMLLWDTTITSIKNTASQPGGNSSSLPYLIKNHSIPSSHLKEVHFISAPESPWLRTSRVSHEVTPKQMEFIPKLIPYVGLYASNWYGSLSKLTNNCFESHLIVFRQCGWNWLLSTVLSKCHKRSMANRLQLYDIKVINSDKNEGINQCQALQSHSILVVQI